MLMINNSFALCLTKSQLRFCQVFSFYLFVHEKKCDKIWLTQQLFVSLRCQQ